MALKIDIDDEDFQKSMDKLTEMLDDIGKSALMEMADALLTLSRAEVAVVSSGLINSGSAGWDAVDNTSYVAYNIEYASYNHEGIRRDGTRRIKVRSGGSKGKWLEDPLKMNLSRWLETAQQSLNDALS